MTPTEFREALRQVGLSQRRFSILLRVSVQAVQRWAQGISPVPGYAQAYLELYAQQRPPDSD